MNQDFTVRRARIEDADKIHRVHMRAIRILGRSAYSKREVESWAYGQTDSFYKDAIENLDHFEVAEDTKRSIVAFAATRRNEVCLLYTDPDWVRRGVGSTLLQRAERHLFDSGHETIWVQSSLNAQSFYAGNDYAVGEVVDYKSRGGIVVKAINMTKILAH